MKISLVGATNWFHVTTSTGGHHCLVVGFLSLFWSCVSLIGKVRSFLYSASLRLSPLLNHKGGAQRHEISCEIGLSKTKVDNEYSRNHGEAPTDFDIATYFRNGEDGCTDRAPIFGPILTIVMDQPLPGRFGWLLGTPTARAHSDKTNSRKSSIWSVSILTHLHRVSLQPGFLAKMDYKLWRFFCPHPC